MKREATGEISPMGIVTDLDVISTYLEEVTALLQLYGEHKEDELRGVNPQEPWTVAVMIDRKNLGIALHHAIEDKVAEIKDLTDSTAQKAYDLARTAKSPVPEAQ